MTSPAEDGDHPARLPLLRCARCGKWYWLCKHLGTERKDISDAHAQRIQAAYAFGKRFNPDHDATSYFDQTLDPVTDYKDRARSTVEGSL